METFVRMVVHKDILGFSVNKHMRIWLGMIGKKVKTLRKWLLYNCYNDMNTTVEYYVCVCVQI